MSDKTVAMLMLGILAGMGCISILAGVLISLVSKKKNLKCTEKVKGKIIDFKFPGDSRVIPIVQFSVNNSVYVTKKRFNGYKKIRNSLSKKSDMWEDERGYLHLSTGVITNINKLANTMWPVGSLIEVFYCPDNPQINYVEQPTDNHFLKNFFLLTGVGLIVLGIMMYFLVNFV